MRVYEACLKGAPVCHYQAHLAVLHALGGQSQQRESAEGRLLFHLDNIRGTSFIQVRLPERWTNDFAPREYPCEVGSEHPFRIQLWRGQRRGGKVIHAVPASEMTTWFHPIAHRHGFEVTISDYRCFPVVITRPDIQYTAPAALVQGRLQVADEPRFKTAVRGGIGRHKAFGFGLLQLD